MHDTHLTDSQWNLISPLISNHPLTPDQPKRPRGRPRKVPGRPYASDRAVLEGIFYVLLDRCSWADLPRGKFPSYITCYRRFAIWQQNGVFPAVLTTLEEDLHRRTGVDLWQLWARYVTRWKASGAYRYPQFEIPPEAVRTSADKLVFLLFAWEVEQLVNNDSSRRVMG